jgi:hypothetical protein
MVPKLGLGNAIARIVEDMTFITTHIQSYICGSIPDFNREQWLLQMSHIQNSLLSLPPPTSDEGPSMELFIYECCRLTVIVYCKAIISRIQFSVACIPDDLDRIYTDMNLVPITRWMQISGIWL